MILKQLFMHIGDARGALAGEIAAFQSGGETSAARHPSERGSAELELHKSCLSAFQSGEFRAAFVNWPRGLYQRVLV